MPAIHLVFTTCPDPASAERIATTLIDERLAACASHGAVVHSTYRWQGQRECAEEVPLQLKTASDRLEALIARLRELHPHELPEIVAVEAGTGLPAYLDWVVAETR